LTSQELVGAEFVEIELTELNAAASSVRCEQVFSL
jgi:hypothetical protein